MKVRLKLLGWGVVRLTARLVKGTCELGRRDEVEERIC
jgi:hypothetical protein